MTKKGLSLEQKRERILEIFHSADDVYQLKEIEKEAVKRGVTLQSVKEVVQSLVDDDLVHQEKIGISNFLWSFAAEASTKAKNDERRLLDAVAAAQAEVDKTEKALQAHKQQELDFEVKAKLQATLQELANKAAALQEEKAVLAVVDPDRYNAMLEACTVAKDSANRWLDNTHALKQWCNKSFGGREKEVDQFFEENGLTDKMDYLT